MPPTDEKIALARRMHDASQSELWRKTIVPYLEGEIALQMEQMASQTDALQLMRYAGAVQALRNLCRLEAQAKEVLERESKDKFSKFSS